MKNLILLLALTCSHSLFSQEKKEVSPPEVPKQKFSFSIIGGLNRNNMPLRPNLAVEGSSLNERMQTEHAYFIGMSARQPICNRFAAKMDVQHTVKGFGVKMTDLSSPLPQRYQFSYLEFVPQVEYNVYKNIFLSLGGYGAFRYSERIKIGSQEWGNINPVIGSLAEDIDWGLASGLRLEFGRFSALVKYHLGLAPAIKLEVTDDIGETTSASQYHRSLQIGLGFKIF